MTISAGGSGDYDDAAVVTSAKGEPSEIEEIAEDQI
jgi:hypothetical protein